ncbi:hypothetical protein MTR67_016300 [Solanum verrucosum]|uniref:Uncharacterized protein n=1 Tax=Solanum verrucosum TaxID=315347 RepID=A0AAF0TR78_SOLVR|nr:hypothetical protein MTR67_016300 [Solanum verrucosum]
MSFVTITGTTPNSS